MKESQSLFRKTFRESQALYGVFLVHISELKVEIPTQLFNQCTEHKKQKYNIDESLMNSSLT